MENRPKLATVPDLAGISADPARVSDLPPEEIPALRGKLAELDTLLLGRWLQSGNGQSQTSADGDRLLNVVEAARKLGKSKDHLYRHADDYPFTVRDGRSLRFSEQGIEKFIRQRVGR